MALSWPTTAVSFPFPLLRTTAIRAAHFRIFPQFPLQTSKWFRRRGQRKDRVRPVRRALTREWIVPPPRELHFNSLVLFCIRIRFPSRLDGKSIPGRELPLSQTARRRTAPSLFPRSESTC